MEKRPGILQESDQSIRGITLTELLVSIAIIGILVSSALPSLNAWHCNIIYRQAARSIMFALREARSKAITTNLEHRVELDPAAQKYRITQGNRTFGSTDWSVIVRDWASLPREVQMKTNVPSIQMNTNGTANGGTIKILDSSATPKFAVIINRTGRIRTT